MNLVYFLTQLNQPPTLLEVLIDLLRIVALAAICYLAVWVSSKGKPLAEGRTKEYRLWGILYVALLCFLPYILPQQGILFYLLSLVTSVMHPNMAAMVYMLHNIVLRPLVIAALLAVGEYFLLRKAAEEREKLKKALRIQAAVSLALYVIVGAVLSHLLVIILQIVL